MKPNGSNIPLTKENVLEYIYLFVEHRLLGNHIPCLEALRRGVFDVIPADSLSSLTSEDLRLILCGNQEISVTLLESYTKFSDESSASAEVLAKYRQWFWGVISKFLPAERQVNVYLNIFRNFLVAKFFLSFFFRIWYSFGRDRHLYLQLKKPFNHYQQ